jgi:hypothetical protein
MVADNKQGELGGDYFLNSEAQPMQARTRRACPRAGPVGPVRTYVIAVLGWLKYPLVFKSSRDDSERYERHQTKTKHKGISQ